MKTRQELEQIKSLVDLTYNNFGNKLIVDTSKPCDLNNPELGYCYKSIIPDVNGRELTLYKIVCSKINKPDTDLRVMMHEYGHIYFGHLDGVHEMFDTQICNVFRDHRAELIERINTNCGIDFADKLIERVIDDPVLNHSLHNIAMDMEINSKVLSTEDVDLMEKEISEVLVEYRRGLLMSYAGSNEEVKKQIEEQIDKMKNESLIKFIVPCRYYLAKDVPFPDGLSYAEYLILIIEHLDQFVKMLVSIKNGGNGDTSQVSAQDVQDALNKQGQNGGQQGQQGGQGGQGSMQSLDDLMQQMGMSDGGNGQGQGQNGTGQQGGQGSSGDDGKQTGKGDSTGGKGSADPTDSPYKGTRDFGDDGLNGDGKQSGGSHRDHRSPERQDADKKRELGEIHSGGGQGCGSSGGPDATRQVKQEDEVDMAIEEVIQNFKSRVVKREIRKDSMYSYNHGINRSVIAPTYRNKVTITTDPKIVYLIDISGSMDTRLVDRILTTISKKMRKIGRGLHYDIISWSTCLGEHIEDIDPKKGVPRISMGGGTRMAGGMKYFKEHYSEDAILILISDFEDYLQEWHQQELTMSGYTMYGFNYGSSNYNQNFKYFKVKNFNNGRRGYGYY